MPEDRSTGGGRAVGGAAVNVNATPERGVPPREVIYKFRMTVSDDMRGADKQVDRHGEILEILLDRGPEDIKEVLPLVGRLIGFVDPFDDKDTILTYSMPRRVFLQIATESALAPNEVIGIDGSPMNISENEAAIQAAVAYRRSLDSTKRKLLQTRLGVHVDAMLSDTTGNSAVLAALDSIVRIVDKLGRLDNIALLTLVQNDPFHGGKDIELRSRPPAAIFAFEGRLDDLLRETMHRTKGVAATARSLHEAIAALQGFDRAWQLRMQIEKTGRRSEEKKLRERMAYPAGRPARPADQRPDSRFPPLVTETEKNWLALLTAYRAELATTRAAGPWLEADFDRRLNDFRARLEENLAFVAAEALSDLFVRIDDAHTRGYPHLEALYEAMSRIVPKSASKTLDPDTEQKLKRLARDFPVMGYSKLRDEAVEHYRFISAPKVRLDLSRRRQFAMTMNSQLVMRWRWRTKRAQETISHRQQDVWRADVLVQHALDLVGVPAEHFLRDVAAKKSQEIGDAFSKHDLLLMVLSVALVFFGPGGVIVGAAIGAYEFQNQIEDQVDREVLVETGGATVAPSGWWLVLSLVVLGFDLGGVARVLGVARKSLVKAIEDDAVDALLRAQRKRRIAIVEEVVRKRKGRHSREWDEALTAGPSGVLSMNGAAGDGLLDVARVLVRVGYMGFEEALVAFRVFTDFKGPDAVLAKAFARARKELRDPGDGIGIDELQSAVKEHSRAEFKVYRYTDQVKRREAELIDAIKRGDESAQRLADSSLAKVQRQLHSAQRNLGRVERLQTVLDARIARLKVQRSMLNLMENDLKAMFHRSPRRYQKILLLEERDKDLRERLATLDKVKRGVKLTTRWQRAIFHEELTCSWLREQGFHRVGDQVKIRVKFRHGNRVKTVEVTVDNLVEVTPRHFRVYDAKWSDSFHMDIGDGGKALTTDKQKLVYSAIARGDALEVRIVDFAGAEQFGLMSGAKIVVEPRVLLVLNQIDGGVVAHVLRWLGSP